MSKILIIDDEIEICKQVSIILSKNGYNTTYITSYKELSILLNDRFDYDLVLVDLWLKNSTKQGIDIIELLKKKYSNLIIISFSGHANIDNAIESVKVGANDFIEKPFDNDHMLDTVKRALDKRALVLENRQLKQELETHSTPGPRILGNTPAINQMRNILNQVIDAPADVLIDGETGTGKELVARYLHDHSVRKNNNFVALNCGAIPETIIESELFGAESGAYTGANKRRIGKFEHANGGTIFLDEIDILAVLIISLIGNSNCLDQHLSTGF